MSTDTYDARLDLDVILLSPFYSEMVGSRALAYIRKSDNLPTLRELHCPISSRPTYAVMPGMPSTPR